MAKTEYTFVSVNPEMFIPGGKAFCREMLELGVVRVIGFVEIDKKQPKVKSDVNNAEGRKFVSILGKDRAYKRCGYTVFARAVNAVGGKKNVQTIPELSDSVNLFLASSAFNAQLRETAKDMEAYLA